MDMGLTEIQQMLKSSAQEFLARECPTTLVREMEEDERGYPDELWRQMTGLGWAGVPFPEVYGGTGGDFLDLAVLLEEMGRALVPSPYFSSVVLGGLTVLDAGSDAQKRRPAQPCLRWQRHPDASGHGSQPPHTRPGGWRPPPPPTATVLR